MTDNTAPVVFPTPEMRGILQALWDQAAADNANGVGTWDSGEDVPDWMLPDDYPMSEREEEYRAGYHYPEGP